MHLNVFSIGNNKIESYEQIKQVFKLGVSGAFDGGYQFKELQVLNVAGNPFTQTESDYRDQLIFHLVNLKYLDYVFIDEAKRKELADDDKFSSEANTIKKEIGIANYYR